MATKKKVVTTEEPVVEIPVEEKPVKVEKTVKKAVAEVTTGIVVNCERLFVRKKADKTSQAAAVLVAGTEVRIDAKNSTKDFYKVSVKGINGFCAKAFIEAK